MTRLSRAAVLLALFLVSSVVHGVHIAGSHELDATTYQISPSHDGIQPSGGLAPPLIERWRVTFDDEVSYPLIVGDRVFVTVRSTGFVPDDYGSRLYALDRFTGDELWGPIQLGGTYFRAGIAADAQSVYAINGDGVLRAFDAGTGAMRWATDLPVQWSFTSPPTVFDGKVYVAGAGSGGRMYAVDGTDGSLIWMVNIPDGGGDQSAAVVTDDSVYLGQACLHAYRWDRATGALIWHHETECFGGGGRTPVLYDGELFVRDHGSDVVLDAATGAPKRVFDSGPAPTFSGRVGFFPQANWYDLPGAISAIDLDTGSVRWTQSADGGLITAPLFTGGHVYIGSRTGRLYALDPTTGNVAWSTDVGAPIVGPDEHNVSSPLQGLAAAHGSLLVPATSTLVSYRTAESLAIAPTNGTISVGETQQFEATLQSHDGTGTDVTDQVSWSSTSPSVASVDAEGLVTAHSGGATTVSATLGRLTVSTTLTVLAPAPPTIALSPSNATIRVGKIQRFTAVAQYMDGASEDVTSRVAWSSANPAVATISPTGFATGKSSGTTTITATFEGVSGNSPLRVLKNGSKVTAYPAVARLSPTLRVYFPGLVAQLHSMTDQRAIEGRWVSFVAGGQVVCNAKTDSYGTATCGGSVKGGQAVINGGYTAAFAGDVAYLPSSASAGLISG